MLYHLVVKYSVCLADSYSDCLLFLCRSWNKYWALQIVWKSWRRHVISQRLQQLSYHVLQAEQEQFDTLDHALFSLACCEIIKKSNTETIGPKGCALKLYWRCWQVFSFDVLISIRGVFSIWYKTVLFWRAIKCFSSTNYSFLKNWTARIRNLCSIKFLDIVKTAKPNKNWKCF